MADLVTHLCVVLLPGALVRARGLVLVALGATLPDLTARVPPIVLESVGQLVELPELQGWSMLHEPLPQVALCVALASTFAPEDRRRALVCLLLGVASHIGLDVLQDHHGWGYALAFPLHWGVYELGWIGSQATVDWAPWLAAATGLAWLVRLRSSIQGRAPAASEPSRD